LPRITCRETQEVALKAQWSRLAHLFLEAAALSAAAGSAMVFAAQEASRDQAVAGLYSPDPWVRLEAVDRLAQLGTTADADLVIEVLYDSDPVVREHAQAAVWVLWSRSGDAEVDRLLKSGIERMEGGEMGEAVEVFTRVIDRKPEFAEGWNKRATAYYLMGDFDRSLKDCDEVIKRNPQHFGALSGYGMIYTRRGDLEKALDYFERALEINPNLKGVEETVWIIRHKLQRGGKGDI
jgi:tetratricopeptide (TPR) repeat protein